MSPASSIVYVVDDDEGMLRSLEWLLGTVKISCACFQDGTAFLAAYSDERPSCVILDLRMPLIGGFEVFQRIRERKLPSPVIFVTANGTVPMAVNAIQHGAFDFIEKPYEPQEMLDLVFKALQAAETDVEHRAAYRGFADKFALLSNREREVLREVVRGKRSKVIAYEMGISCKTVDVHRTSIKVKFRATSVAALVNDVLSNLPEWRE